MGHHEVNLAVARFVNVSGRATGPDLLFIFPPVNFPVVIGAKTFHFPNITGYELQNQRVNFVVDHIRQLLLTPGPEIRQVFPRIIGDNPKRVIFRVFNRIIPGNPPGVVANFRNAGGILCHIIIKQFRYVNFAHFLAFLCGLQRNDKRVVVLANEPIEEPFLFLFGFTGELFPRHDRAGHDPSPVLFNDFVLDGIQ